LFADDISIPSTHSNTTELNSNTYTVFETVNTWFKNNYLSLNFWGGGGRETDFIHFKTRYSPTIDMNTGYNNKLIPCSIYQISWVNYFMHLSWRMPINHQRL